MPKPLQQWLSSLVSFGCLAGFVGCYVVLFRGEWDATTQPTENFLELTAGLTGMVSGVVATIFGVKVPDPGSKKLVNWIIAAGGRISPVDHKKVKVALLVVYFVFYAVMALWALLFWIGPADEHRPETVDHLWTVAFGVFLAIGSGHLGTSQ